MKRQRVVISGMGVVTAAGCELRPVWSALMSGQCFIKPLTRFAHTEMGTLYGAEVSLPEDDRLPTGLDSNSYRARCLELALAATRRAIKDAKLLSAVADRERVGVSLGTTLGEERQIGDLSERRVTEGDAAPDAGFFTRVNNHRLAAQLALAHGLGGPVSLTTTACSSGNAAIAMAFDLVASGEVDAMLAGGTDTFTRLIYCGFQRMGALSRSVCKPFDVARDGVAFGEGAGMIVVESLERAQARGAHVYAEIAGYGMSNDAHHITAPGPQGEGFVRAMQQACATTSLSLTDIGYVSAHGTGTVYNDKGECEAMRTLFGAHAKAVPISSIKSMIGHTNGAASAIEAVVCALALQHQSVPPTAGLQTPDPDFELDYVPGTGRAHAMEACFSLAAGFGGHNVCLALKRVS